MDPTPPPASSRVPGPDAVTVVIPTFNRAPYIAECIDSLLAQTMPPAQIIVVNDGSTDDTRAVLRRFEGAIRYIEKPNGGKASALNLAMPLVTTPFVWFFDDDDVAHPWALASHLQTHSSRPHLGFSFGFHQWGTTVPNGRIAVTRSPVVPDIFADALAAQRLNLLKYCAFMLCACVCRTEAVRSVGLFDTQLKRSQDYDFIIRLAHAFDFAYCGSPTYVIREHEGVRGTADSLHASHQKREIWRSYDKVIGRKLLELSEMSWFLDKRTLAGESMSRAELREAHVNRAAVLFSKALLIEGVADLRCAASMIQPGETLSAKEVQTLSAATDHPYFRAELVKIFKPVSRALRALSSSLPQRQMKNALLKGLYWQLRLGDLAPSEKLVVAKLFFVIAASRFLEFGDSSN